MSTNSDLVERLRKAAGLACHSYTPKSGFALCRLCFWEERAHLCHEAADTLELYFRDPAHENCRNAEAQLLAQLRVERERP